VYKNIPRTLEKLKENIRNEIRAIPIETLTLVMENVVVRARLCEEKEGGHLRDNIFHK